VSLFVGVVRDVSGVEVVRARGASDSPEARLKRGCGMQVRTRGKRAHVTRPSLCRNAHDNDARIMADDDLLLATSLPPALPAEDAPMDDAAGAGATETITLGVDREKARLARLFGQARAC
jgi:hypothetical protein